MSEPRSRMVPFEVTGLPEPPDMSGLIPAGNYVVVRGVPEGYVLSDSQGNTWAKQAGGLWSCSVTKPICADDLILTLAEVMVECVLPDDAA